MQTTIVIPCYNESKRLQKEAFAKYLENHADIQFLFVNDGSTDDTLLVLNDFANAHKNAYVLDAQPNSGKAEAVRKGMMHAYIHLTSDLIAFWDADLATPLDEIDHFITNIKRGDYDMVTGLRLMRLGCNVKRKTMRHHLGRCFATVASQMLQLPVYDTQCGAKMYKREIVEALFSEPFITRWLFDVELLSRYIKYYGRAKAITRIYEYPILQWNDVNGSQLKLRDFIKAPLELIKINHKYR